MTGPKSTLSARSEINVHEAAPELEEEETMTLGLDIADPDGFGKVVN